MAIYHLRIIPVSRGSSRSAVLVAADRAGEILLCQRTGIVGDARGRRDVEERFIVAPKGTRWAQDRSRLWNAVEAREEARNARTAREIVAVLPEELTLSEGCQLARKFAEALVERYGAAIDVSIHAPDEDGHRPNWHAHFLMTARKVAPEGLGEKTDLDLTQAQLVARGLPPSWIHVREIRALWADLTNRALARAGHEARIYSREGRGGRRRRMFEAATRKGKEP